MRDIPAVWKCRSIFIKKIGLGGYILLRGRFYSVFSYKVILQPYKHPPVMSN